MGGITKKTHAVQYIFFIVLEEITALLRAVLSGNGRTPVEIQGCHNYICDLHEGCSDLLFVISPMWLSKLVSLP